MARGDLRSLRAIYFKGLLFLVLATIALVLLLLEHFSLRFVCLQLIVIWAFCRAYYFAFYVIENYVDSQFKYAGLIDFARYLFGKPRK